MTVKSVQSVDEIPLRRMKYLPAANVKEVARCLIPLSLLCFFADCCGINYQHRKNCIVCLSFAGRTDAVSVLLLLVYCIFRLFQIVL